MIKGFLVGVIATVITFHFGWARLGAYADKAATMAQSAAADVEGKLR